MKNNIRVLHEGWCGTSITRYYKKIAIKKFRPPKVVPWPSWLSLVKLPLPRVALLSRYTLYLDGFFQPKIGKNGQRRTLKRLPNLKKIWFEKIVISFSVSKYIPSTCMLGAWDVLTHFYQKNKLLLQVDNHFGREGLSSLVRIWVLHCPSGSPHWPKQYQGSLATCSNRPCQRTASKNIFAISLQWCHRNTASCMYIFILSKTYIYIYLIRNHHA